jgi:signal transduction histidine kinase
MFWKQLRDFTRTISFRLNLWHAGMFLASAALLFTLIYFLLSAAIDRKDRDVIEARLREYAAVYESGGIPALRDWTTRVNEARKQRMYFVRVATPDRTVLLLVMPQDWFDQDVELLDRSTETLADEWIRVPRNKEIDLTVAATELDDGMILQVGRSSDSRASLLGKFRQVFVMVIPPVLLLGFIGGAFMTRRMTKPVSNIVDAASSIINTGRLEVRVPERPARDELQDLVTLFNRLLAHNEALVLALRDSLDNVAHDLRTPLARLRAALEGALREKSDASPAHDVLVEALEETDRIETIIRTLMDVAQAEAGLMRLEVEKTEIALLVDDVVELYEHIAQEKGIQISNDLNEQLSVTVDPARMRQVFANLLDNAIKYTPPGGQVSISAHRHDLEIELKFRDNGPGISEADLPRIWERLYRADKSRNEHGLGLGLSLVKAIVEAHQGRIGVASEEGKGAEFSVFLPIIHSRGTAQAAASTDAQ